MRDQAQTSLDPTVTDATEPKTFEYAEKTVVAPLDSGYTVFELAKMDNIATVLSDELLKKISNIIDKGYVDDLASRSHREQKMQDAMDLALQIAAEKTSPWPDCANVVLPIITTAGMQFAARAYPAIIHDDEVAKGTFIGSDDGQQVPVPQQPGQPPAVDPQSGQPQMQTVGKGIKKASADRVAKHLNAQLLDQMESWVEDTDRLVHILPVTGTVFRKVYWDAEKQHPETGLVMPKNFIVSYFTKSLKAAPRISAQVTLYPYEIMERIRSGQYVDFKFGQASDTADETLPEQKNESGESVDHADGLHLFIEQLVRLDLDGDDYPEPYIVTMHFDTKDVVRIRSNYELDKVIIAKDKKTVVKITPEVYYVKYGFIPSPDGSFYDLGYGEILTPLNAACNSIINRLLDAGTLATTSSGFIGKGLRIKGGAIKILPGKFPVVDSTGGAIKDNFVQFQHPEPSGTLFQLLEMLIGMASDIASTNDVMQGDQTGNISGITTLQLVEQGMTGFKAIYKRIHRSIREELDVLRRLNQLWLSQDAYAAILSDPNANKDADYGNKNSGIVPVSDPTAISDLQKLAKAQALEVYKDDPFFNGLKIREIWCDALNISTEGLLKQPAPPPPDPMVQVAAMDVATKHMRAETEQLKAINEKDETHARVQKIMSETVKNLALAESSMNGDDMEKKRLAFDLFQHQIEQMNVERGISGVAGSTSNT